MKIAFPSQDDKGAESAVYSHFGSADFFVIAESEDGPMETVVNQDRDHMHGHCQPRLASFRRNRRPIRPDWLVLKPVLP